MLSQLAIALPVPLLAALNSPPPRATGDADAVALDAALVLQDLVLGFQHSPVVFLRLVPALTNFVDNLTRQGT